MQKASAAASTAVTNNNNNKRPVAYAFIYVNSPATKEQYPKRLRQFFDFIGLEPVSDLTLKKNVKTTKQESEKRKKKFMDELEQQAVTFLERARQDESYASEQIMFYLDHHKQRVLNKKHSEGYISAGTLHNLVKPIRLFIEAYRDIDTTINWKRIKKALPRTKTYANDRAPTIEELRKLVEYGDRRIKALVYTTCCTGIRLGAWVNMRWKDITVKKEQNEKTGEEEIKAARLLVYAGEGEEYVTFMTPEAYFALKEWMDFRASYGEKITGDSYVMRTLWRTVDIKRGEHAGNLSKINEPEKMTEKAISRILIRGLQEQGIRPDLPKGVRRHEFQGVHGMRKFLKTRAEQVMLRTNVEYIIGHSLGISQSYYRPTEHELYTDYLKAIPLLTVSLNLTDVQKQQEALEKRDEQQEQESEKMKKRIEELTEEQKKLNEMVSVSMQTLASTLRMFTSVDAAGNVPTVKARRWMEDTIKTLKLVIAEEEQKQAVTEEK